MAIDDPDNEEFRLLIKQRDHGLNYGMNKKKFDDTNKIIEHDCKAQAEQGTVPAHFHWPWRYVVFMALFFAALALLSGCTITNRNDMPKWKGYQLIFNGETQK